jgi:hypothetical protein
MDINLEFDAAAMAAPQSFRDGMQAAANTLDQEFAGNYEVNVSVGYGDFRGAPLANQDRSEGGLDYQGVGGAGFVESYSDLRSLLAAHATSQDQQTAVANLPDTASLQGRSSFKISSAQAKAMGVLDPFSSALDGAVGMGTLFVGTLLYNGALHELTHALGRLAGSSLDLFRFNEDGSGNRVYGAAIPATPAYFSIDGGATKLADFGINSDPGDWLNGGVQDGGLKGHAFDDPFDETVGFVGLSQVDITAMNVLGFAAAAPANAGLVQDGNGNLDYLQYSGPNLVASDLVPIGTSLPILAEGDFANDGVSQLVGQDPNSGSIDLLTVGKSGLQSSQLEQGSYWNVVGAGDFDRSGRTAIATQNAATGQVDLLWFTGTQLTSSLLLDAPYQHVVGAADFNGDGQTDLVTQDPTGGQLDFLFFNGPSLVQSAQTPDSYWPVHDVTNSGNQSIMVSQDPASGQLDYLQFNGTSIAQTLLRPGAPSGFTPVQGTQAAAQLFSV